MFTVTFWKQTAERAIKSAAQALLGLWVGDQAFDAWNADWKKAAGVILGAVVLSVLTSLASAGYGRTDSPSLVDTDGKHGGDAAQPELVKS
jgi:Putative lactococcus lactis phage r1t holin